MRVIAILFLLLSACVVHRHDVMPVDLAREAGKLARQGHATVSTNDGAVDVSADDLAFVHLRDDDSGGTERPVQLTVRALVEGCAGDIDSPGCKAGRSADQPALTKKQYKFSPGRLATTLSFAVIGAGVTACVAECEGAGLEKGATYVGIGAAVLVGTFLLFAIAG